MRKLIKPLFLSTLLFSTQLFALHDHSLAKNECLKNFDERITDNRLNLQNCNLTDDDMKFDFIQLLSEHPNIDFISLSFNNLSGRSAFILKQIEARILYIEHNHLDDRSAASLAKNSNIHQLYIDDNNITEKGFMALAKRSHLILLETDSKNITSEVIEALAQNKYLTFLFLNKVHINTQAANALRKNTNINFLTFSDPEISLTDFKAILQMPALIGFGIGNSNLTREKILALTSAANLEYLLIRNENLKGSGAAIAAMPKLRIAYLTSDKLDDWDAANLALNTHLSSLNLYNNDINSSGAISLANSPAPYYDLDLSFNHIGASGLAALRDRGVPSLHIEGNDGTALQKKDFTMHDFFVETLQHDKK